LEWISAELPRLRARVLATRFAVARGAKLLAR
jgi:hypothetical protein